MRFRIDNNCRLGGPASATLIPEALATSACVLSCRLRESEILNVLRGWGALDISLPPKVFRYPSGYITHQRAIVEIMPIWQGFHCGR
jgi:hypothetical protein